MADLDIPAAGGPNGPIPEGFCGGAKPSATVLVCPHVLGGRGMAICYDRRDLEEALREDIAWDGKPVLIDRYLEDAFEIDVDALGDSHHVTIGGIMQHIEEAGVHSGDSACVLPPYKISYYYLDQIRDYTERIGLALKVKGPTSFANKDDGVRAGSQSAPADGAVCSKATGVPLPLTRRSPPGGPGHP
jgi:carbamoyl-phosphate synthase large subunit